MAYRGDEIGIGPMLDELVTKGRTEFDAAVELENALKDGKIILWYAGAPVVSDIPAIGRFLRDFVSDRKKARLGYGHLSLMLADARAQRVQFEKVCGLIEAAADLTPRRQTAEQACESLILELKKGPRLRKFEVRAKAFATIPDLIEKEFDRAWRSKAGDWATGGRPTKTLN
jgi:hypothetical protein